MRPRCHPARVRTRAWRLGHPVHIEARGKVASVGLRYEIKIRGRLSRTLVAEFEQLQLGILRDQVRHRARDGRRFGLRRYHGRFRFRIAGPGGLRRGLPPRGFRRGQTESLNVSLTQGDGPSTDR